MATARIPVDDFERGAVPAVCPISGDAATDHEAVSAVSPIGWKWFLLILGVVPFLVVWAVTRRTANGSLPISPSGRAIRAQRTRMRLRALGVALLGVPVALLIWYGTDIDLLPGIFKAVYAPLGTLIVLGGLGAAAYFAPPTKAVVEASGRWVNVEGASARFADEVREQATV